MGIGLIYGIGDCPPLKETLFAAIQHLLAIFVAIITPPLIIAGALKLDLEATGSLVSMALFTFGVSTFIQCHKLGPVGVELLCVRETSFPLIDLTVTAGLAGGFPLILGTCIAVFLVEMIVSYTFKYPRSVTIPSISGIVALLIDLSLVRVGVAVCGGGYTAVDSSAFGSLRNTGVAVCVLLNVLFFSRCKNKYLRIGSTVLRLRIGCAITSAVGMVDMEAVSSQNLRRFNIPVPFKHGLDFSISSFVMIALVYLITAIKAAGDITTNSIISRKSIEGEDCPGRIPGGVPADRVNSSISGIFNFFLDSIFVQSDGIIQLTGVVSRYVGCYIAGMSILSGLFPVVDVIFSLMPDPVLGGATLLTFGTVVVADIRIIAVQDASRKATLVLVVSLSLGLGVELMLDTLGTAPQVTRGIFPSGITTGGLVAVLANLFIRVKEDQTE